MYDSLSIIKLPCHIEGNMRRIYLVRTSYDVTDDVGVECVSGAESHLKDLRVSPKARLIMIIFSITGL